MCRLCIEAAGGVSVHGLTMPRLFHALVPSLVCAVVLASENSPSRCVSNFLSEPEHFFICKFHLCFIYVSEPPFAFPNAEVSRKPTRPFPCYSSRLKGQFADTLYSVGSTVPEVREAYCVYGGESCRFDDIITFVNRSRGSGHHFVAGSYLVFLPYRRTEGTIHSAPFISDEIVLMQSTDPSTHSWGEARNQIVQTFSAEAWFVVFVLFAVIIALFLLYFLVFPPRDAGRRERILWCCGQTTISDSCRSKVAWRTLLITVTVFFTTLVLTFEISAAVRFFRGEEPEIRDISQVTSLKPSEIAVVNGSASEAILRRAFHNEGFTMDGTDRWVAVRDLEMAIDAMLKPGSSVKYVFEFEKVIKYSLSKRSLCQKVTGIHLQKKDFGGWYYSSELPSELRTRVDKALLGLVLDREPARNVKRYGEVDFYCGENPSNLGYKVLIILFGFTMMIPIVVFCFLLIPIATCYRKLFARITTDKKIGQNDTRIVTIMNPPATISIPASQNSQSNLVGFGQSNNKIDMNCDTD